MTDSTIPVTPVTPPAQSSHWGTTPVGHLIVNWADWKEPWGDPSCYLFEKIDESGKRVNVQVIKPSSINDETMIALEKSGWVLCWVPKAS